MRIISEFLNGAKLIEPTVHGDKRGSFCETYQVDKMSDLGIVSRFMQDNVARSSRGILRGLHYQVPPFGQGKLVQVLEGKVLDVIVDIRPESATYGQHRAVEISEENHYILWVPRGFAHGYVCLSESCLFHYKCDQIYHPQAEGGIKWDDPELGIDWRISSKDVVISPKDAELPLLKDAKKYQ